MNLQAATNLLQTELKKHDLLERGWKGELDEARRRFGVCRASDKVISLSRPLIELNSEDEVHDTILHEIAHALAWEEHGENCGHDERWKVICLAIGARPERCYDDEVLQPEAPWVLMHRETDEIFASYQNRPRRDFSQVWIRGRKEETLGKLELKANPKLLSGGKIERFERQNLTVLQEEVLKAVKAVAGNHGLDVDTVKSSFNSHEYDLALQFKIPVPDGVDPEKEEFELIAGIFGLQPEDYMKPFRFQGKTYLLVGFKPRNRKYPVIGMDARGKRYKFDLEILEDLVG